MKMIRIALFMFTIFSFLYGCTGRDTSEEKIRITIEQQSDRSAPEPAKKQEQTVQKDQKETESKPAAPAKPEPQKALSGKLNFKAFADNLNVDQHSKNEIDQFWLSVRGKTVIWGGNINQIKIGRNEFRILVDNWTVKSKEGFNIVLLGLGQTEKINPLYTGQTIIFSGVLTKFDYGRNNASAVIVLRNAKIF